jgi:hypothetical protein
MHELFTLLPDVAESPSTVLIEGEPELVELVAQRSTTTVLAIRDLSWQSTAGLPDTS